MVAGRVRRQLHAKARSILQALGELPDFNRLDPTTPTDLLSTNLASQPAQSHTYVMPLPRPTLTTLGASALSPLCQSREPVPIGSATLSNKQGGLGLRQSPQHCAGAILSPSLGCIASWAALSSWSPTSQLLTNPWRWLALMTPSFPRTPTPPISEGRSQRHFPECIEAKTLHLFKASAHGDPARRAHAHFELTSTARAGASSLTKHSLPHGRLVVPSRCPAMASSPHSGPRFSLSAWAGLPMRRCGVPLCRRCGA